VLEKDINLSEWQKRKKAVPGKYKAVTEIMTEFEGTVFSMHTFNT
jgi:hypothetical protein